MTSLLKTKTGRLRLIAWLEGFSLLILIFIAVPVKHILHNPAAVAVMGPVHGAFFLLFVFNALSVGVEQQWKRSVTLKVLIACLVPFGTFYIDTKILKHLKDV